ncbi:MAG: hypothetical protein ABEI11_03665 [Haloarculaceae archaeon]
MRTVRDGDGDRYLLVKRSGESSLVRDPETGEERYLPNAALEPVDESALAAAAAAVPAPARRACSAVRDDESLGLLVEIDRRGPIGVRALLSEYDRCESDLHGLLGEFRAAGLIEEADVAGELGPERGYATTGTGAEAVRLLRAAGEAGETDDA